MGRQSRLTNAFPSNLDMSLSASSFVVVFDIEGGSSLTLGYTRPTVTTQYDSVGQIFRKLKFKIRKRESYFGNKKLIGDSNLEIVLSK